MEIKKIDLSNLKEYRHVSYRGYPNNRDFTKEGIERFEKEISKVLKEDNEFHTYGAFQGKKLIGIMFSIDLQMNIYDQSTKVSGLGTLAVDPFYKRKGIGRKMVDYFEEEAKSRGINTLVLLPFRPDYYVSKGYGFLTKMDLYQIETHYFPVYRGDLKVRPIHNVEEIYKLHNKLTKQTHGMIELTLLEKIGLEEELANYSNVFVGVYKEEKLKGYTSYKVESLVEGNYTLNYLKASDLIFEDAETLYALLGHLRGQQDQAEYVQLYTQLKGFEQIFTNPLDQSGDSFGFGYLRTNTQGIGLMGKIINPIDWLKDHENEFAIDTNIQWNIDEEVYGHGQSVKIKREHLAPLLFGSVSFNDLYRLGLIKCSPELAEKLSNKFTGLTYPINHTDF